MNSLRARKKIPAPAEKKFPAPNGAEMCTFSRNALKPQHESTPGTAELAGNLKKIPC
jgi:hypothetical protein